MLVTSIRDQYKKKLSSSILTKLIHTLDTRLKGAGYHTDVEQLTSTSIKIGLHMCSFRVDTSVHGHNARIDNRWIKASPKGYKRTNVPTWDQRVEFNDIVNDVLDAFEIVARVKSGCYTIRDKERRYDENDWYDQTPINYAFSADADRTIMTEKDARDELDSDEREKQHAEKMKPIRQAQALKDRERRKAFESCSHVILAGFSNWPKTSKKNGKRVTMNAYLKILASMSNRWEAKSVKKRTVDATLQSIAKPTLTLIQGGAA